MPRQTPNNPRLNSLVILYVNTRPTDDAGNPVTLTQDNIADYVTILDTSGDTRNSKGGREINYESQVKNGGNVTWFGVVSNFETNPKDYIIVYRVTQNSGNGTIDPISFPTPRNATYVQAHLSGGDNSTVEYTVTFNIHWFSEEDQTWTKQTFSIDPKLRIH